MSPQKVLVTGATGFVGGALVKKLLTLPEVETWAGVRDSLKNSHEGAVSLSLGDIDGSACCKSLLGLSAIVHCAARVHAMSSRSSCPLSEFRKINVDGTLKLARQAAREGVKRFVFISSIKVNGEGTSPGHPYRADDAPLPSEPYGISKLEAEEGLFALAKETGMEVVIIRPVLIYGPGVKGNFSIMMKLIERGVPLPLGAVHNKRSLIGIDNLVDLIIRCIDHPAAANQVFLASDGEDLSTTELLRGVANAMGKPARLIPVPAGLLQLSATLLGRKAVTQRLLGSLQVDIRSACEVLDWKPPRTVEEGLRRCFEPLN